MTPEIADNMVRLTMENGGGTFDYNGKPVEPKNGYAVGMVRGSFMAILPEESELAYSAFKAVMNSFSPAKIGTWMDDDGVIWIDPIVIVEDRLEAEAIGRENRQKAIYDFANRREIRL